MKKISFFVFAFVIAFSVSCTKKEESAPQTAQNPSGTAAPVEQKPAATGETKLKADDLTVGKGAEAVNGKMITVHYTGTLTDGKKFDSSKDRNQPFTFNLGAGQVIRGWDVGIAGSKESGISPMKIGGKRKLTIPPDMGYGAAGAGGVIPPNATLVFDVELLEVK